MVSGPNQFDLYPNRMIRAFGTAAGNISSSCNHFIHRGSSLVPRFFVQVSSGWAPRPWTATILPTVSHTRKPCWKILQLTRWSLFHLCSPSPASATAPSGPYARPSAEAPEAEVSDSNEPT